jgi:hypothetical protein
MYRILPIVRRENYVAIDLVNKIAQGEKAWKKKSQMVQNLLGGLTVDAEGEKHFHIPTLCSFPNRRPDMTTQNNLQKTSYTVRFTYISSWMHSQSL